MSKREEFIQCVVLVCEDAHEDSALLPDELRRKIEQFGERAAIHHDACLAMAELCLADRLEAGRAAWGLPRTRNLSLVLWSADLSSVKIAQLLDAVRKYLPETSIFKYGEDAKLRPISPSPRSGATSQSATAQCERAVVADDPELDAPPRITAEELAMLFGRDGDEADHA